MFSKVFTSSCGSSLAAAALAVTVAAGLAGTASASIIYSDSFPGSTSATLNGTTPGTDATGAKWNAPALPSAGGWSAKGTTTNTTSNQFAYLTFMPQGGNVYTLSAILDPTGNDGNWLALGFSTTNSTALYTNGGPWMLLAGGNTGGGIQFFSGTGTNGGQGGGSTTYPMDKTAEVVLNTQATQWTAQWYYNNALLGSYTYTGTGSDANPTGITAVGIDSNVEPGSVGSFSLTSAPVPEPATLGLVGIGALGLLLIKRRKTV